MVFLRDCGASTMTSAVLESVYIPLYTVVLRAVLPCTHEKILIFRGALKV